MSTGEWQVLVRDADRRVIGEVTGENDLEVIDRHLAVGAWKVTVDAASHDAALLREGAGIVFLRDGEIAFSGPTRQIERVQSADDGGVGTLIASGACDKAWLSRLVWPVPGTAIPETGTTFPVESYELAAAPAETVLRTLVDKHAGPGAAAARRVPGLTLAADGARGTPVSVSSRFGVLLDTLVELGARGGVGFDVVQRPGGSLEFAVYPERDRRAAARFSIELGNLRSYQYTLTPPEATFVIVADDKEKTARRFYGFDRPDPGWPGLRAEDFVDGADLGTADPVGTARTQANTRLDETAGRAAVTFEPIDTEAVVLGRDYRKGDRVSLEIDGVEVDDLVREIRYTRTAGEGQVVVPIVGADEQRPRIYEQLTRLRRRIHSRETRR
ncbi:hypothetical protein D0T12_25145 [Actinomadura spongiicola]|uniref:Gp28/Gp37-like domain-containing protein n=1 Tax=Actinomadura spongiicola TaxID=2303421 RepID=A0A372GBK0_9ACTN|nr:siphovirus ReqiPepy6 Gp37-like family protein [Actinomadura spongiicola]RFS82730.1 hypothetical protein D0T12_25145 [Actinomadura spongiicola]